MRACVVCVRACVRACVCVRACARTHARSGGSCSLTCNAAEHWQANSVLRRFPTSAVSVAEVGNLRSLGCGGWKLRSFEAGATQRPPLLAAELRTRFLCSTRKTRGPLPQPFAKLRRFPTSAVSVAEVGNLRSLGCGGWKPPQFRSRGDTATTRCSQRS